MRHFLQKSSLVAGLGLVLIGCGDDSEPQREADFQPELETVPCRFPLHSEQKEGSAVVCGDLRVPAHRDGNDSAEEITLHWAHFRSTERKDALPIVEMLGGPGESWGSATRFISPANVRQAGRDLLILEQRGVGESAPDTRCEGADLSAIERADDPLGAARKLAEECAEKLEAKGVSLEAFHTSELAEDMEELRRLFDFEQFHLFGFGYGSRVVLDYMRRHPDRVASAVLESVSPPHRPRLGYGASGAWEALQKLFESCAQNEECTDAFPDIERRYLTLLASTQTSPIVLPGTTGKEDDLLDAAFIQSLVTLLHVTDIDLVLGLIHILAEASELGELESRYFVPLRRIKILMELANEPVGMALSIFCADNSGVDEAMLLAELEKLPEELRGATAEAHQVDTELCKSWPHFRPDDDFFEPVASQDIPTLLLHGTFDPHTPLSWAESTVENLDRAQLVAFPAARGIYNGVVGNGCSGEIVASFLDAPNDEVPTKCLEDESLRVVLDLERFEAHLQRAL